MPDFGIMRGFGEKLFGDKLYAGQLPTRLGLDSDAQGFFNRVTAAGGTLSSNEQNAINQLVTDLKNAGIWTSMKAIYPMVGASAAACAQNLKSSSFTGTFTSGWTFSNTGATPNGTSAYMNTQIVGSNLNNNSIHLSYYRRTTFTTSRALMGGVSSLVTLIRLNLAPNYDTTNNNITEINSANAQQSSTSISNLGLIFGNRIISTEFKVFVNGNVVNTVSRNSGNLSLITNPIFIGSTQIAGVATDYTNNQCAFASIGDGLTDTQASNFYTAVQAFQTTLSRQV